MEIKQYTLKQPIDQRRNHKRIRKYPETNENKNITCQDLCGGAVVKNLPANAGDTGSSPGPGRPHMPWSN